jgi:hypothetical protein
MRDTERGVVLILVLLGMMLLSALGMALTLTVGTETRISATHVRGLQAFYAADAAFERAVYELSLAPDWDQILAGTLKSSFVDGGPGPRVMPDGSTLDLNQATDGVNCGRFPCSVADLQSVTAARPWGQNNPVWQIYACGAATPDAYVVVWVADDPLENDAQPLVDGDTSAGANPGEGLLQLLVHAHGRAGALRVIEGTIRRVDGQTRVVSWREVRR